VKLDREKSNQIAAANRGTSVSGLVREFFRYLQTAEVEPARKVEDLFPGCRIAAEGRHVILFRISDSALKIVRVLHVAMDFKRPLPKE